MKKYFCSDGNEKQGPFTIEELKNYGINKETLIWFEGIENWSKANDLAEMKPILELSPPPIPMEPKNNILIEDSKNSVENRNQVMEENTNKSYKEASPGWIMAGFIFSFLGGFIGIAIGFNYAFGNYKKETKNIGWIIAIIGIISLAIWRSL